jgi:uncharacterized repeat protein (TIGR03987 family)
MICNVILIYIYWPKQNLLMLPFAIITITLALLWYSVAVWAEKISSRLKFWHVIFFWIGFISDATGTVAMTLIRKGFLFDIHGISGPIALLLMLFHAVWATIVISGKDEERIRNFHKFSMFVWMVWLIPYMTGIVMHMKH